MVIIDIILLLREIVETCVLLWLMYRVLIKPLCPADACDTSCPANRQSSIGNRKSNV